MGSGTIGDEAVRHGLLTGTTDRATPSASATIQGPLSAARALPPFGGAQFADPSDLPAGLSASTAPSSRPGGSSGRRSLLAILAAAALPTPGLAQAEPRGRPSRAPSMAELTARANAGTVGVISGGVDGTYVRIAADLAAVLDDGDTLRVLAILGKGSLQNIRDLMLLRGIDVAIVQSDALAYARREQLLPQLNAQVQYITKLYDEEVHILTRPGIATLADLAGQEVNVDVEGSGTAMTASLVFERLGIQIRPAHDPQDTALTRLTAGEIAAMVFVAGRPARIFAGVPPNSGLFFLPVPENPALLQTYLPSRLTSADYPYLVPEGTTVDTIAVGAVMAVYGWPAGTERHRKVARFVDALHANFQRFLVPPRHPKWREVDLAAEVPGWVRFDPRTPTRSRR